MSTKSLRRRFFQTLIIPILLTLFAVGVAAFYFSRHEIEEVYDAELARNAKLMLALMRHEIDEGEPNLQMLQERFGEIGHTYEKHIALRLWHGDKLYYQSESAQHFGPQHVIAGFSTKTVDNEDWRFFVLADPQSGLIVEAAEKYLVRLDIIHKILISMFTPAAALLLVIPPLFWLGLRYGFRPLVKLSEQVGERSPDDLAPISEEKTPKEILPLTHAINHLLKKLQTALSKERRFTDLAAHELKTPLAVIKTLTQSAQRAKNDAERQRLLADLNVAADRASAMMTQLLTLARLDQDNLKREKIAVETVIREAIEELALLASGKQIQLSLEKAEDTAVNANREMLLIAIRNLIENAIKYTPGQGSVSIDVSRTEDGVLLSVSDNGPGIPEDKLSMVSERFYRIPGNAESGSGLGLTIVTRVAELNGATLRLKNLQPHGLRAELLFLQ